MPLTYAIEHDGAVATLPPPMRLFLLTEGVTIQAALTLATNLGIANLLADGPQAIDTLARETSTHAPSLYRVLRLLSSVGVFSEIDGDRFAQTAISELLRTGGPASLRSWVRMTGLPIWPMTFADALHSVRTGEPVLKQALGTEFFTYLAAHPHEGDIFNAAMGEFGQEVANAITKAYDFSDVWTLIDVGGGHGTLLRTILLSNTHLKGVLFDLPHVAAGAQELMASAGLADRCEVRSGDFFAEVPAGGDAYILSWIIHDWNHDRAVAILKKCRQAMTKARRILLIEAVIPPGNEPHAGKIMDFVMLVALGGQERTTYQYEELLREAGFRLSAVVPTASPMSVIEGRPT
ncbi:MAG: methyltransferase [Steroidobacteraceae bacterium]